MYFKWARIVSGGGSSKTGLGLVIRQSLDRWFRNSDSPMGTRKPLIAGFSGIHSAPQAQWIPEIIPLFVPARLVRLKSMAKTCGGFMKKQ